MLPFVRGGDAGPEVPDSAVGESKGRGAQKAGHRSELQRRPDAGPSAYALLRAWSALRNPGFLRPSPLRLSEPLHSHLQPRVPASHPLRFLPGVTAVFFQSAKKDTFPRISPLWRIFCASRCLLICAFFYYDVMIWVKAFLNSSACTCFAQRMF